MSTTLLLLPEFLIGNVEAYTSFTDTITQVMYRVITLYIIISYCYI